jgi:hypothetical protein
LFTAYDTPHSLKDRKKQLGSMPRTLLKLFLYFAQNKKTAAAVFLLFALLTELLPSADRPRA